MTVVEEAGRDETYVFGDEATGGAHHAALTRYLAQIYDPFTQRQLSDAGLAENADLLEVGAGNGSIARWAAAQMPSGRVFAMDTNVSNIPDDDLRVNRWKADVVTTSLGSKRWDGVHARAVLVHVPVRRVVLRKMAASVREGGWFVVDEFLKDGWRDCVLDAPDISAAQRRFDDYHTALVSIMERNGSDPTWGLRVPAEMRGAGMVDVRAEIGGSVTWRGGEAGCMLPLTMTRQLGAKLSEAGMTDIATFQRLLRDPRLLIRNPLMISTIGRQPEEH